MTPDFDDDEVLDAQVLASLHTLFILVVFCAGVAFGFWASALP